MLKLNEYKIGFEPNNVIANLDASINIGEWVTFVGQNGAGKTAVLKGIAGLIFDIGGSITLNKKNVFNESVSNRVALGINMFLQDNFVFNDFSVEDNIKLLCMNDAVLIESVLGSLKHLKQFYNLKGKINRLSEGEQKLISLLCFVYRSKGFMLLDEPDAGLSNKLFTYIASLLLLRKRSIGIIMATHDINIANVYSDKIILFEEGSVKSIYDRDGSRYERLIRYFNPTTENCNVG